MTETVDTLSRSRATHKLLEAFKRCQQEPLTEIVSGEIEQTHHGTTDYALACWWANRDLFTGQVHAIIGNSAYLIPDLDGIRKLANPALQIERLDGLTLSLTGCTWGYGGEGPHGTATILVDLGLHESYEAAMAFVAGCEGDWVLVNGG